MRSVDLNPFQFAAFVSQYYGAGGMIRSWSRKRLTQPECHEDFVERGDSAAGPVLRTVWCARAYRDFAGIYDVAITTVTQDRDKEALISRLAMQGVSYDNALTLAQRFVGRGRMGEVMGQFLGESAIWVEILSRPARCRSRAIASRRRRSRSAARTTTTSSSTIRTSPRITCASRARTRAFWSPRISAAATGSIVDRERDRRSEVALDGEHELRIGATLLRVRTAAYAVPAEQPVVRGLRFWPAAIACIVGVFVLAALDLWLSETVEPKAIRYFTPLLILVIVVCVWTTGWSVVTRVFTGHARFGLHFLIVGGGPARVFDLRSGRRDRRVRVVVDGARDDFVRRRVASARRARASRIFSRSIAREGRSSSASRSCSPRPASRCRRSSRARCRSNYGQPVTLNRLEPPALRLVSPQHEAAFFTDAAALRASLDKARTEEPSGGDGPGEDSDE